MRGLGEAASGRWRDATSFMEQFVKYNPTAGFGYRFLSMIYGNTGRQSEAKTMFDRGFKDWPPTMKNVRFYMSQLPFKDLQVAERIAEGYIKAGLGGKLTDIYEISAENRLTSEDIRELFFGRNMTGFTLATGKQWWVERSKDGKAKIRSGKQSDTGKSWIEEDMLCDQWDNLYESLKDCWVIYRNAKGTQENSDEYLGAPGYGVYPFSVVD